MCEQHGCYATLMFSVVQRVIQCSCSYACVTDTLLVLAFAAIPSHGRHSARGPLQIAGGRGQPVRTATVGPGLVRRYFSTALSQVDGMWPPFGSQRKFIPSHAAGFLAPDSIDRRLRRGHAAIPVHFGDRVPYGRYRYCGAHRHRRIRHAQCKDVESHSRWLAAW